MNIALIGCGSIGSTLAFNLVEAGNTLTVVARPGSTRLAQLKASSAIVKVTGERAAVTVDESLPTSIAFDLVIVTLLAHQIVTVLPSLQASTAKSILFVGNNFEPQRLQALFGERAEFAMPFLQAFLSPTGELTCTFPGVKTPIGSKDLVALFQAAKIPSSYDPEVVLFLRCHAPMCIAFESVAVTAVRRNAGACWSEAVVLAKGVHAVFALLQKQGMQLYPSSKVWMNRVPASVLASVFYGLSRVKSFRDLLATGEGECRAMLKTVLAAAKEAGLSEQETAKIARMEPAVLPVS